MERDKLVEKLIDISEQERKIREQIEQIDYKDRFDNAKQYEGRFFKEVNDNNNNIRCLFIYETEKESCQPMGLCVSYWEGNEKSYFEIEYYHHFNPKIWDEDIKNWIEIKKDEYMQHYHEVQKRISLAVSSKNQ